MNEIIVDNFAGGGGASTGIELGLGCDVAIAINHDPEAVAMHRINHPTTEHYTESIFDVDPVEVCRGRPVGLAWFSPDCKHFSRAAGKRPRSKNIRGLAWVVINWVNQVAPRVIMLENVEEFQTWGPLDRRGKLAGHRKGWYFDCFVGALRRRGYKVEFKTLVASDFGAPTIRKRLFLIARRDGESISWPRATHGEGLRPFKTAADCIDWSIDCPSIFERKRPLAEATCRRIAKGVVRYVMNADKPFIAPFITECANGSSQRNFSADEPLRTQCAQVKGGHFALVTAFLAKHYSGVVGHRVDRGLGTVTAVDHHSLVSAHLCKMRGDNVGDRADAPLHTISAGGTHHALVAAFMTKYYGSGESGQSVDSPFHTVTSRDRFNLVTVVIDGEAWVIKDIGLRMLQPHELYAAQGFPGDYIIDRGLFTSGDGYVERPLTKTAQVRMCGNSVCPPVATALAQANVPELMRTDTLKAAI